MTAEAIGTRRLGFSPFTSPLATGMVTPAPMRGAKNAPTRMGTMSIDGLRPTNPNV